ncbi:TPA: hypothetical protein SMI07_000712 [Serratia liquefaciens]|nr:hypothetical protein [Serratia liquefaciens]
MQKSSDGKSVIWHGSPLSSGYEGWPCLSNGDIKSEVPLTSGLLSAEQIDRLNMQPENLIDVNLVVPLGASFTKGIS